MNTLENGLERWNGQWNGQWDVHCVLDSFVPSFQTSEESPLPQVANIQSAFIEVYFC